ncbi:MAG: response regulator [Frankiaceae bacterium]
MATRVLVVDDDPNITDVLARYLTRAGYDVLLAHDGAGALDLAARGEPDLVVLDVMLPPPDGLEVCRQLRSTSTVPVIMLTALGEETDRLAGLEIGADDYVTKPFSPREVVLRVQAVLRRSRSSHVTTEPDVLRDGDLVLDLRAHEAIRAGRPLALTAREFDLLAFLLRHPRQAFTRTELLEQVWGWSFGDASTVTVHVRRLREKVEPDPSSPRRIVTVPRIGYRLDPVSLEEPAC